MNAIEEKILFEALKQLSSETLNEIRGMARSWSKGDDELGIGSDLRILCDKLIG